MASDRLFDERARRIVLDICHVFPEVLGNLGRRRRELADPQLLETGMAFFGHFITIREADRGALRFGQNVADVPLAHAAARFPSPLHDRGAFNRLIEAGDDEEDPVGSREVILLKRKL